MNIQICDKGNPGSQPPLKKWWFLLDDDKPLRKDWWIGNQPIKYGGWTSRENQSWKWNITLKETHLPGDLFSTSNGRKGKQSTHITG